MHIMVNKFSFIVFLLATGLWTNAVAQSKSAAGSSNSAGGDKYVAPALTFLKANDLENARKEIDKAFSSSETKAGPKTLLAKAQIYFAMNNSDKYRDLNLYRDGTKALFKIIDQKPDYEKSTVDQLLLVSAYLYYNDGAKAYNDKQLTMAPELMKNVVKIHELNDGRRFEHFSQAKQFDTIAAYAYQVMAGAEYFSGKYDEAIPLLVTVKNNPITKTPSAYDNLIYSYNIQKSTAKAYEVIEEARQTFPDDMVIRNYELNYFIKNGNQEDLLKKTDEALAKDPKNADLLFNEAVIYMNMANPPDGKKPENSGDLNSKAEDAFQRVLVMDPDNASYNYSFATFYYNRASDINDRMNAIKGAQDADVKKQEELKGKADALLTKAMPYFEKAYALLSATANTLRDEDKKAYSATMLALIVNSSAIPHNVL